MILPISYHRGRAKPYGSIPRINWDHPLSRKLVFYHYDAGGAGGYDLASGRPQSLNSANPVARRSSPWGTGYVMPSSVADGLKYDCDTAIRIVPPFSFAAGFMRTTDSTKSNANIFGRSANGVAGQPFWNWQITENLGSTLGEVGLTCNDSGAVISSANTAITTSTNFYHSVVASATNNTAINWWLDGLPKADFAPITALQSFDTSDPILIGADNNGPNGYQGMVFWGAFWNRSLTQTEANQLDADPYCFLIYPEDNILSMMVSAPITNLMPQIWM